MSLPPLTEAMAQLRAGQRSAQDLARAALENDRLGAYCARDPERTLAQAAEADDAFARGADHGPLQGVPVSVKDLFGVQGYTTFAGTPRRLPPRFETPGPVVQRLTAQHGCITGKTHTVELAFGGIGTNPHYPTPKNPWAVDQARAPGGSSAGAGVSLCEGSAMLALGTDTAGSCRIPAAWTGTVGLKTTRGRWPTAGVVPLSSSLDTVGLLARTAVDLAVGFAALDAPSPTAASAPIALTDLRLARCDAFFYEGCSPGVVEAVERALSELSRAGARLTALELPEVEPAYDLFLQGGPVAPEAGRFLATELPEWLETMDPNVRARIGDAAQLPEEVYQARLQSLADLGASLDQRLRDVDLLCVPAVANTPPRLADLANPGVYADQNLLCLRNTSIANYLGLCAITLPVGLDAESLPVGLMLMARGGRDAELVQAAVALESCLGTAPQRLGAPPGLPAP